MANNRYRTTTAVTVPSDSAYEAGWRAALYGQPRAFGARSRTSLDAFNRGYQGGAAERQRIHAAQARAAAPLSRDEYAHAFLRGAIRGQRSGVAQFGGDPRVAQAYATGFRAMQAGHVLTDRGINWRSGWGVVPLTTDPGEIRALAAAIGDAPLQEELLARVWSGPPVHIKR